MYSIYHGGTLSDEKVSIDSNERALEKIQAYQRQVEEEKLKRRRSEAEEYLSSLPTDDDGKAVLPLAEDGSVDIPTDEDGHPLFSVDGEGHPYFPEDLSEEDAPEDVFGLTEEEKQRILDEAQEEADSILAKAKAEADALFLHTRDEAVTKGYNDGYAKASADVAEKEKELEARADALERNYQEKQSSLEKEVLDAVLSVVEKAFLIEYGHDRDLLLRLVDDCINHVDSSKELLVRANEKNYSLLISKRDEIKDKVGEGIIVEYAKDPLLDDGECMIETDGGVYDVSIDTELTNLIKRIRLLTL